MIALLNRTIQNSYFSYFSWSYFYNAGYFAFDEFNGIFLMRTYTRGGNKKLFREIENKTHSSLIFFALYLCRKIHFGINFQYI